MLNRIYGSDRVGAHNYGTTLSSLTFAGTVVGMLIFGYLSDKVGRKFGMVRIVSSAIFFFYSLTWHRCSVLIVLRALLSPLFELFLHADATNVRRCCNTRADRRVPDTRECCNRCNRQRRRMTIMVPLSCPICTDRTWQQQQTITVEM